MCSTGKGPLGGDWHEEHLALSHCWSVRDGCANFCNCRGISYSRVQRGDNRTSPLDGYKGEALCVGGIRSPLLLMRAVPLFIALRAWHISQVSLSGLPGANESMGSSALKSLMGLNATSPVHNSYSRVRESFRAWLCVVGRRSSKGKPPYSLNMWTKILIAAEGVGPRASVFL